jgi:hypothetical protein
MKLILDLRELPLIMSPVADVADASIAIHVMPALFGWSLYHCISAPQSKWVLACTTHFVKCGM